MKVLPFFTWHLASDVSPTNSQIPHLYLRERFATQAGTCSAQRTLTPARLANGTSVFIQPDNLKEHFKITKEEGADGMVVWGMGGPHVSARPGARLTHTPAILVVDACVRHSLMVFSAIVRRQPW